MDRYQSTLTIKVTGDTADECEDRALEVKDHVEYWLQDRGIPGISDVDMTRPDIPSPT